jgi:hypothetical protein
MLGVGRRGTVTAAQDLVAVEQGLNQSHCRAGYGVWQGFRRCNLGLNTFGKTDFDSI